MPASSWLYCAEAFFPRGRSFLRDVIIMQRARLLNFLLKKKEKIMAMIHVAAVRELRDEGVGAARLLLSGHSRAQFNETRCDSRNARVCKFDGSVGTVCGN